MLAGQSFGLGTCVDGPHQGSFVCGDNNVNSQCNDTIGGSFVNLAPGFFADRRNLSSATTTATTTAAATAATVTATMTGAALSAPITPTLASAVTPTSRPNCDSENGKKAAIGAGIGIPLGLALIAAVFWALWERRLRHHELNMVAYNQPIMERKPELDTSS